MRLAATQAGCMYALLLALATPALAEPPKTIDQWVNDFSARLTDRDGRAAAAELADVTVAAEGARKQRSMTSNQKQREASAAQSTSTTLVDSSGAADFVSVALNIAGLGSGSGGANSDNGGTVTVNTYAFYSAVEGPDSLKPSKYCSDGAVLARRLSWTLGYDDGSAGDQANDESASADDPPAEPDAAATDDPGRAITYGVKLSFANDPCRVNIKGALEKAKPAALDRAQLVSDATRELWKLYAAANKLDPGLPDAGPEKAVFFSALRTAGQFETRIWPLVVADVAQRKDAGAGDSYLQGLLGPQRGLVYREALLAERVALNTVLDEIEAEPGFALSFVGKDHKDAADLYRFELIWDQQILEQIKSTVNASLDVEDEMNEGTSVGGRVAGELSFDLWNRALDADTNTRSISFSLGFEGQWLDTGKPRIKGQVKTVLPVGVLIPAASASAVEVPLSITLANRTELVDEEEVRGQIGFTIDTSQLVALVSPGG